MPDALRVAVPMRAAFWILVAVSFASLLAAFPAHASSVPVASLAFDRSPRGHVLVPVSIDGLEPLVFVLDTGAGRTLVTPEVVKRLGLQADPGKSVNTMGVHGTTATEVVTLASVAVGDARAAGIDAVVFGLEHITRGDWHADGVLGIDFLDRFDVRLDFGAGRLGLFSTASDRSRCAACPEGIEAIAFETVEPGFIVLPVIVDEQPVRAVLDTGSGHSGLNGKAAAALGVALPSMPDGAAAGHGFGLQTGPLRVGATLLAERATLRVMDHPVMEALGLADAPAMLLGTDQLVGRVLTISYGLGSLFLQ